MTEKNNRFIIFASVASHPYLASRIYRVVQLNLTPEIEVFFIFFDPFISSMTSLKQHMEYYNFRCKIQVDITVYRTLL